MFEHQGNITDALVHAQRSLELARTAGSARVLARSLNKVGWFHALLGEPKQALTHCVEALTLTREIGDRRIEANTLHSLGYAYHRQDQHQQAIDHLQRSAAIKRELGDRHGLATVLDHLGDAHLAAGDRDAARNAWHQALDILDQLGLVRADIGPAYPDAHEINKKLHRLDRAQTLRRRGAR